MVRIFYYDASCTVQPDGIPEVPEDQPVILAALTKVPEVVCTPSTQYDKQLLADMSVARHLI